VRLRERLSFRFWANILTLASVAFLAYYLVQQDFVTLSSVKWNTLGLVASVAVLCIAVVAGSLTWAVTLRLHGKTVSLSRAISSHGLSVFAKYIPGKIWTIVGRAGRIGIDNVSFGDASMLSLKAQLTNVWTGLALGIVPTLLLADLSVAAWAAMGFVLLGMPFLFVPSLQRFTDCLLRRITRGRLSLPPLSGWRNFLFVLPFAVLWALYILAFGLFLRSLSPSASLQAAFAFPLAMNIGLLAIVIPGGLGVREGVLAGLLVATGQSVQTAATIALLARLWFTVGEVFIFAVGGISRFWESRSASVDSTTEVRSREN